MFLTCRHNALIAFAFILLTLLAFSAVAEDEVKVDYMSLTALMIKEGDYVRAGEAINTYSQANLTWRDAATLETTPPKFLLE